MALKKIPLDEAQKARLLAELHRDHAARQAGYRERALKLSHDGAADQLSDVAGQYSRCHDPQARG